MTHRFLPHTADIKVAIEAPTFAGLLAEAAIVARHLFAGSDQVRGGDVRRVAIAGEDETDLLFQFLRELIYHFSEEAFVPAGVEETAMEPGKAVITVRGEHFDPVRHSPQPEVKAVTRHDLKVRSTRAGWSAEVIFDV